MKLEEKISDNLRKAMKEGDQIRRSVLSLVKSAIHNQAIKEGKQEEGLSDDEVIKVLSGEAKKRKDAIKGFEQGGRREQAEQEKAELKILEEYLPEQLSSDKIREELEVVIKDIGSNKKEDFGRIMGEAMKKLKGQADGLKVKEELGKLLE